MYSLRTFRNIPWHRFTFSREILFVVLLSALRVGATETAVPVSMQADRWLANGNAAFSADDQRAGGLLDVTKGSVTLKDVIFSDGTIDVDMYIPEQGIFGIRLRAQDRDNAEAVYFRPQKDCNVAPDCLQYMPVEHGAFEWDLFPEYEAPAPIQTAKWNHIRLVVQRRSMRIYVNHAAEPTLFVEHMEGKALSGAIILGGPAKYANLVIVPAPPVLAAGPGRMEMRDQFLRHWQISQASVMPMVTDTLLHVPTGVQPPYASMPPEGDAWRTIKAQAKGLVNFSHELGSAKDASVISLAWAKTTLVSDKSQSKMVKIGWAREIWVYVNGRLVFSGRNLDSLPAANVAGQRISLENGAFEIPLNKGKNEIAIALDDNLPGNSQHFGWGMEIMLQDMRGISLQ